MGGRGHGKVRTALMRSRPDQQRALDTVAPETSLAGLGLSRSGWSRSQQERLRADWTEDELEILPKGEVYTPHVHVRSRLDDIFGPGNWGLQLGEPKEKSGQLIVHAVLFINGVAVAEDWGGNDYNPKNSRDSWSKSLKSAKSDALKACCKDIGMARQAWNPRWQHAYKLKWGVLVTNDGKPEWRHLLGVPRPKETGVDARSPNQDKYRKPTAAEREAGKYRPRSRADNVAAERHEQHHEQRMAPRGDGPIPKGSIVEIGKAMRTHERSEADVKKWLKETFGYVSRSQIQKSQFNAVMDWIRAPAPGAFRPGQDEPPTDVVTGEVVD